MDLGPSFNQVFKIIKHIYNHALLISFVAIYSLGGKSSHFMGHG